MKQLTISQALEQGYEHCFVAPADGYQRLTSVSDLTPDDFNHNKYILAEKEENIFTVSGEDLREILVARIIEYYEEETGDDDSENVAQEVSNAIGAIDKVAEEANEIFKKHWYKIATEIELVP